MFKIAVTVSILAFLSFIVGTYLIVDVHRVKKAKNSKKRAFVDGLQVDLFNQPKEVVNECLKIFELEGKIAAPNFNMIITDQKRYLTTYSREAFMHQYNVCYLSEGKTTITADVFIESYNSYKNSK